MDPFVGEIRLFPWNFNPRGWALCQGQLLAIAQNQALFSLLGTTYGGNGTTTFALPDLRGRTADGMYASLPQGTMAGNESVTLTIQTMPAHNHALNASTATAAFRQPAAHTFGTDNSAADFYGAPNNLVTLLPTSIGQVGGNTPHANIQPYLTLNYSIALQGIFPSRN